MSDSIARISSPSAAGTAGLGPSLPLRAGVLARPVSSRAVVLLYLFTAVAVVLLMGLLGLAMRAHQAQLLPMSPATFYAILTLHGVGMVSAAVLATAAALWYVVGRQIPLASPAPLIAYVFAVAGLLCVAAATLGGGFAGAWTFLYPLPFFGWWPAWATAVFLLGQLLIGVCFGLFCLDLLVKAQAAYGGLGGALAVDLLLGRPTRRPVPEPPVLIATVTSLLGLCTVAGGTVIVVGLLGRQFDPAFGLDPLWAKNVTYFYGHNIANLTIYMAAGMLYAILPRYAGRSWHTSRAVVLAWWAILCFVLPAYFHHLYMDFVQPKALDVAGEGITDLAVTGSLVVTIFGALLLVWRSGFRWTLGSVLLYAGFSGWLVGGVAAVLDVIIPFNFRLHNTLWVVGHFHAYVLLGVVLFFLGFLVHLLEEAAGRTSPHSLQVAVPLLILGGGFGLVLIWLLEGLLGVPRRYGVQPAPGPLLSAVAVGAVLVLAIGLALLLADILRLAALAWHAAHVSAGSGEPATVLP
jgi:cytochrome c oxidase subunit 1